MVKKSSTANTTKKTTTERPLHKTKKTQRKTTPTTKTTKRKESSQSKDESFNLEIEETPESYEELQQQYTSSQNDVQNKILPNISTSQMEKAINALNTILKTKNEDTVNVLSSSQDEYYYVNFIFDKIPLKYSIRPIPIKIPNSIYSKKYSTSVCLFVKDPKSDFKDLQLEFPFNLKVIDISKLKLKYDRFEQRRNLLKEYDIFLCDARIYFVLKKFLGKPFYAAHKFPVAVKLDYTKKEETQQEIINHVEKCVFFHMSKGIIYNIKFAREVMSNEDKLSNLKEVIAETLPHILKYKLNWEDLKMINIKGNNTLELPIYNHLKEEEIKMYLD